MQRDENTDNDISGVAMLDMRPSDCEKWWVASLVVTKAGINASKVTVELGTFSMEALNANAKLRTEFLVLAEKAAKTVLELRTEKPSGLAKNEVH